MNGLNSKNKVPLNYYLAYSGANEMNCIAHSVNSELVFGANSTIEMKSGAGACRKADKTEHLTFNNNVFSVFGYKCGMRSYCGIAKKRLAIRTVENC